MRQGMCTCIMFTHKVQTAVLNDTTLNGHFRLFNRTGWILVFRLAYLPSPHHSFVTVVSDTIYELTTKCTVSMDHSPLLALTSGRIKQIGRKIEYKPVTEPEG